jgi:hypothetical protein
MERLLVCDRHATATKFETAPMKPLPPVSLACPMCLAERNDRALVGTGTESRMGIVGVNVTGTDEAKLGVAGAAAYDAWKTKQREAGKLIPGSPEETEALAQMDEARFEAIALDHGARGGRVVTTRYVDGVLTNFVKVRGRRGLMAVQA